MTEIREWLIFCTKGPFFRMNPFLQDFRQILGEKGASTVFIFFYLDGENREIPTDDQLHRDVDRPLHCENQVRCNFHNEIDCDYCAKMECYRIAYALSHHLKKLVRFLYSVHLLVNSNIVKEKYI